MKNRNELKYNAEGYYDPTAYKAMKAIRKEELLKSYRPLVFISSPYSGDVEKNTSKAKDYCRFAVRQKTIPIAPHLLYPQFMEDDNPDDRKLGLFFSRILLDRCSEIWVFGVNISPGMELEIKRAKKRKILIRYFDEKCREVVRDELS